MDFPWYKIYPKSTAKTIDLGQVKNIGEYLDNACSRYSRAKAFTCMGTSITYENLHTLSDAFANFLIHELGLKPGDRLAIMLPNIIQFPVAFLGCLKAGVVCVNTNPLYTAREMKHQFNDAGAKAIVIIDLFADKLEEILTETKIEHVIITSMGDQLPIVKGWAVDLVLRLKKMVPKNQ